MGKVFGIIGMLLLALIVFSFSLTIYTDREREENKANAAMFDIAPESVDRITIAGPGGARALLLRVDEAWILPDLDDFPADAAKVNATLHRLLAIDRDRPVTSSADDLAGLRLTGDSYARRVALARNGETLTTLYIGTPQGPRQVHARRADEDTAYTVTFGFYDAAPVSAEWIDKAFLQRTEADIAVMEVNGLRLVRDADDDDSAKAPAWRLAAAAAEEALAPAAAERLAGLLAGLTVETIVDGAAEPEDGLAAPLLNLTLATRAGKRIDYRLGKAAQTEGYVLAVSTRPERFRLSAYAARHLIAAASRETLLAPQATAQHAASAPEAGSGADAGGHN
ncbi:MAG: DUF4340 domain-containing protein [Kiloniellaceae bacterium]